MLFRKLFLEICLVTPLFTIAITSSVFAVVVRGNWEMGKFGILFYK
jgi:hypothetical protein